MTENTARNGPTSGTSTTTARPANGASGTTKVGTVRGPQARPATAPEIDEQTHRRGPATSDAASTDLAPAAAAPSGEQAETQQPEAVRPGASPVKDGAVKAAAAALAAARSAAKKVQSAIPDQGPRTSTEGTEPATTAGEARPEMHYSAGGVHGTALPGGDGSGGAQGVPNPGIAVTGGPREAGPRRVRLSVSRVDPWSVMKLAFLLSVAIGFMIVVATMVVWYVLNDMGTFATIQDFLQQTVGPQTVNIVQFIAFDRIVSLAVLLAIVDVVLMTAIATILAILYNVTAALVGGVHLTLTDE